MKSTVLLYLCLTWCLLLMVLYVATNHAVNFINVSPGTTIIMEYNYTDTTADWNGPDHENIGFQIVKKDMYGKERTWNVTSYASKGHINPKLLNAARLRIVGDEKGQYLQIENISLYDAGLYRCDIMMNYSVIFEFFILQVKQKHYIELDITYQPYGIIKEGQSLSMCCHSNSTVSNQTLRWFNEQRGLKEPHKSSEACLFFKNVSRNDSGIYTCIAECNGQIGTKEIILSISYIPDLFITFEPSMLIYEGSSLRLCCLSNNILPNTTIGWVNTKVRRQDRPHPSTVCLHFVKTSRNDSGIYTCKAEYEGQEFTANITLHILHIPDILFTFEPSMPIYEGSSLRLCCISKNSFSNATIGWFNTKVCRQDRPNPSTVCLHFVKTSRNDSGIYTCKTEQKGQKLTANITLNVLPNFSLEENTLSSKDVAIIVLLVLIAVILVVTGIYVLYLKRSYRKRFIETIHIQAEEDISANSAHYIDITEVNNVLTTSQENNSQNNETNDTEAENISIAQMSAEQNSSLSNSNSDIMENLNSGYEHPYTTLVANNVDEDEHVYDVSKQNSAIENILLSMNAACEPFDEIIEQDLSSDNIRARFYANEGQGNVKLNDNLKYVIAKDNGSHSSSFLSKKYEPEYINLSLKQ